MALVVLLVYYITTIGLLGVWINKHNPTYDHGLLLLSVALLLFLRNVRIGRVRLSIPRLWLPLSAAFMVTLLWFVAALVQVQVIEYIALVILVLIAFHIMYGGDRWAGYLVPLCLLFFALPFWNLMIEPLRQLTIICVRPLLIVAGFPAYIDGHMIHTPGGAFSVEPECSGMRQFIVAAALGLIMGEYWLLTKGRRILLLVGAMCVGIASNVIRVFLIVAIGIYTTMQNPLVTKHHETLGWIVFAVVFTGFVTVAARYFGGSQFSTAPAASAGVTPILKPSGLFLVVILIGPLLWLGFAVKADNADIAPIILPPKVDQWEQSPGVQEAWRPVVLGADLVGSSRYRSPGAIAVDLQVYRFGHQHHGKEAVKDGNELFDRRLWTPVTESRHDASGVAFEVFEQDLRSGVGERRLLWSWFNVAGRHTGNPVLAKILQAWGTLTGQYTVDIVSVSAPGPDLERTRVLLGRFVSGLGDAHVW